MNKSISIVIGLVIVGAVSFMWYSYAQDADSSQTTSTTSASNETTNPNGGTSSTTTASSSVSYTMAQIATHKDTTSCWTAIRGNVYDLTQWISKHPGGQEAILSICGVDGTQKFIARHGGKTQPENELILFKIGSIAQ